MTLGLMPLLPLDATRAGALPDEVLTIEDVAALLKPAEKTVYAIAEAWRGSCLQDPVPVAHQAPKSTRGSIRSRVAATKDTMGDGQGS